MRDSLVDQADAVRVRARSVLGTWDWIGFVVLVGIDLAAVGWFLTHWFRLPHEHFSSITYWLATFVALYAISSGVLRWTLLPTMRRPEPVVVMDPGRVAVVTTFVPGLESLSMLEGTLRAMVAMNVAHDTWLLDEGDDDEAKALCARLGARHFSRRNKPHYQADHGTFERRTKFGNYNSWLDELGYENYDVIVGFDPDHVPDQHFLSVSLGYLRDPSVGYVQLPQVYYNHRAGFIAKGAAQETYGYYSVTQMSSYGMGFPIVTGCHQVHRTTALKQVGGFACHDADDLLIALLYRSAGWQGVYVPEIHAWGLTPTDWPSYLRQQLRWSRAVIDIKVHTYPKLAGKLPWPTRLMSLLHGIYYVQEGIIGPVGTVVMALLLAGVDSQVFGALQVVPQLVAMFGLLTATSFYRQRFFLSCATEWGFHWQSSLLRFAKWPYMMFGLVSGLLGIRRPYRVTPKTRASTRGLSMSWPHWIFAALLVGAWFVGWMRGAPRFALLDVTLVVYLLNVVIVVITERRLPAPPFDPALLQSEVGDRIGLDLISHPRVPEPEPRAA